MQVKQAAGPNRSRFNLVVTGLRENAARHGAAFCDEG
jgi:hypothetical protein